MLRKKSILKTVRKNLNNPVSMGLLYDEFARLTKWQKEEAKRYMTRYFSDTGLNWQMKN
jgi:ribosomal protein L16/L10AE